jgi:ubiquinone/menaquinone biosynthesis C-methylase UbiE
LNCDPIARIYRWLEYAAFGRELERRRFRYLTDLRGVRRVLMLGEGDGRFLARFAASYPEAQADYMDASARMLQLARARAGTREIRYIHGDILTTPLPKSAYDLIVTHFFLDCFNAEEQQRVITRLATAAHRATKWLVSEFRQPRRGWQALWSWLWLRIMYMFFGFSTGLRTTGLADHRPILGKQGFQLVREETSRFGLLASELWVRDDANPGEEA